MRIALHALRVLVRAPFALAIAIGCVGAIALLLVVGWLMVDDGIPDWR